MAGRPFQRFIEILENIGPILDFIQTTGPRLKKFFELLAAFQAFYPQLKEIIDLLTKMSTEEANAAKQLLTMPKEQRGRVIESLKAADDSDDVLAIVNEE